MSSCNTGPLTRNKHIRIQAHLLPTHKGSGSRNWARIMVYSYIKVTNSTARDPRKKLKVMNSTPNEAFSSLGSYRMPL